MGENKAKVRDLNMVFSLNNQLQLFAGKRYYIPNQSDENIRIKGSIARVTKTLRLYFANAVTKIQPFGSYERDTILPRAIDFNSDVDIMIVFNYNDFPRTPETYRNNLIQFAAKYYPRSYFVKDFPSIVVDMLHIKLDLIPTVIELKGFIHQYYIPDSRNEWQYTDPYGFNNSLVEANTKYNSVVKPIIRLLKAWNCANGYPYDSFKLEQEITGMDFTGDNIERGFLWAIDHLPTASLTESAIAKVVTLQNARYWVSEYIERGNGPKAYEWLRRILP